MTKFKLSLCVALTLLALGTPLMSQNPHYNNGPVWRVIYVHVNPGMGDKYWTDIAQNFKPIYDEFKKEGWVVDYKFYINPVTEHPEDWDIAIAIEYKNWGTIDEMSEKAASITAKHYGSRESAFEAAKKRSEYSTTVRNSLAREVVLK